MKDTYGLIIPFSKYMYMYEKCHSKYIKLKGLNGKVNIYHVLVKEF